MLMWHRSQMADGCGETMTAFVVCLGCLIGATFAPYLGPTDSAGPMTGVGLILAVGVPVALLCEIVKAGLKVWRDPPRMRWF